MDLSAISTRWGPTTLVADLRRYEAQFGSRFAPSALVVKNGGARQNILLKCDKPHGFATADEKKSCYNAALFLWLSFEGLCLAVIVVIVVVAALLFILFCISPSCWSEVFTLGGTVGALTGPLALPLFHSHKRLALRKALGHGLVWFKP